MNLDPPPPAGLVLRELTPAQIDTVLEEVFTRRVRCSLLDRPPPGVPAGPAAPQWLLAELGDGRITGACPHGHWSSSDTGAAAFSAPAPGNDDRWRILEVLVFAAHAQVRLGEGAERGWISADTPDPLPAPLRPRDRAFLLRGHNGTGHRRLAGPGPHEPRRPDEPEPGHGPASGDPRHPGAATGLHGHPPGGAQLTVTAEPDGTRAVLPLDPADATGTLRTLRDGRTLARSSGSWLTVREYWAEDPATGAVGAAFHRLTGFCTGPDPTGPAPDPGTGDQAEGA